MPPAKVPSTVWATVWAEEFAISEPKSPRSPKSKDPTEAGLASAASRTNTKPATAANTSPTSAAVANPHTLAKMSDLNLIELEKVFGLPPKSEQSAADAADGGAADGAKAV